jgi:hypothetical protein
LLASDQPVSKRQFIDTWLKNDRTVLVAPSENKKQVPDYIPIENGDGSLFTSAPLVGWRHGSEFLKGLKPSSSLSWLHPANDSFQIFGVGPERERRKCLVSDAMRDAEIISKKGQEQQH